MEQTQEEQLKKQELVTPERFNKVLDAADMALEDTIEFEPIDMKWVTWGDHRYGLGPMNNVVKVEPNDAA